MDKPYNVVIADDNPTFVDGLKDLLARRPEFEVLACYESGDALLSEEKYGFADLILLDIEMPGKNGIATAKRINFNFPQTKIIAITMYQDQVYLQQLIEAGFRGFINKTDVGEKLFDVIHSVMNNTFVFPENIELF